MKHTYILLLILASNLRAQQSHQHWKISTKKISANEYDVIFNVKIDKGYHIYSIVPSLDKGAGAPNPTEIKFVSNSAIQLKGNTSESNPLVAFDDIFNTDIRTHKNQVVFKQRVKVLKPGKVVLSGSYKSDECNENGCTYPPREKFEVTLTGK